ncbi:MAG: polysaccharide deacetylase family protein [Nocardioides sp.]|uniref:polysaccharide deacetylase family protein n=1 Tax=Nocardioides sp. TaxID=35761 RepID=UPI0039E31E15
MRWATPSLAGRSDRRHIALTIDDGPDPGSTPVILETLARNSVRATFFVIGEHVERNRSLVSEMHLAGHEFGVHGWSHTCTLSMAPERLRRDLTKTAALLTDITGAWPRWYRPPYGITTLASNEAARINGLTPVLWTAWGRDWSRFVSAEGIVKRVNRALRPGGTVLLHDTDRYASPRSWIKTDRALQVLLPEWERLGIAVGPLNDHWSGQLKRPSLVRGDGLARRVHVPARPR